MCPQGFPWGAAQAPMDQDQAVAIGIADRSAIGLRTAGDTSFRKRHPCGTTLPTAGFAAIFTGRRWASGTPS